MSYGPDFLYSPRIQRRQRLLECFNFKCCCEACEHDWPIEEKLPYEIVVLPNRYGFNYKWNAYWCLLSPRMHIF